MSTAGTSTSSGAGSCPSWTSALRRCRGRGHRDPDDRAPPGRRRRRDAAPSDARTLEEAYDLFAALRLEHQVSSSTPARRPDDHLDPEALNSLTRTTSRTPSEQSRPSRSRCPASSHGSPRPRAIPRLDTLAGSRVLRGRPRDDRPEPRDRRDHLLGRTADRRSAAAGERRPPPVGPPPPDARPGDDPDSRAEGDDLAGAPALSETLEGLLDALTGKVIVAHVASVERGSSTRVRRHGLPPTNPIVDTALLGAELLRRRGQKMPRRSASTRWRRLWGCRRTVPTRPTAMCSPTGQVFLALATHLDGLKPQTVGSLLRPEGRWAQLNADGSERGSTSVELRP